MKTLLIDNYDSYTYNLFQLIAEVNGEEPVVVLNDAPDGAELDLGAFDNIVVSPGPGHPGKPRDFGIGTTLLARARIPVLGVCLGHQGIAIGEQALLAPAPRPRHGHVSTIRHNGRGLFRGLPQNFAAVRYHSLSVREPLPLTLEATAWAEDGVLMGLRHRTRPLWGVQFHPESVLTEFGHRMLANFRDLTEELSHRDRTLSGTPEPARRPAAAGTPTSAATPVPVGPRTPPKVTVTAKVPVRFPASAPAAVMAVPASAPASVKVHVRAPAPVPTLSPARVPVPASLSGPSSIPSSVAATVPASASASASASVAVPVRAAAPSSVAVPVPAPASAPVHVSVPARPPAPVRRREVKRRVFPNSRSSAESLVGSPPGPPAAGYRLHTRKIGTAVDAEAAFTELCADAPRAFWLDSAQVEAGRSRFSFFGDGRGPLAEFVRYEVGSGACQVEGPGRPPVRVPGNVFDYLKGQLALRAVDAPELPFDFAGGYVGYFGFELKADCGSPNRHRAETPDACWLFADRLVAVDHQEGTTYTVCLAEDTPAGLRSATDWLDATTARLSRLRASSEPAAPPSAVVDLTAAEPWLARDRKGYLADIEACKRELNAGVSYEICLTDAARLPAPEDPYGFYRSLRRHNPAPYAAYLKFGEVDVACSSPERFLRITPDGTVEARPIKGTAPRGARPEEDDLLRDSLAADDKTRAENLMIVDLLRNDLGRVCATGTVRVPRLMATETYATVHQLVSTVEGRLREDKDAVDCVRACFPGGSMTGAPKLRTLEIIDSLETEARGVYSGAIGYFGCNGGADLNIVIRTAVFSGGRMRLGAGGAIVLGSDPAAEYDEMLLKTAAPMRAYRETMAAESAGRSARLVEEPTL
ncbi:aminodeoxychorismate synthase component I [Streptomyces sp. NPDC001780]